MMTSSEPNMHWQDFAKHWNRLGSPLRPCAEDVENFRRAMGSPPGRSLLLGVTPELAGIAPDITAIDNSAAMIEALCPNREEAILGDWLDMPFTPASFDTVIGDGCLVLLSHPEQHRHFFEQVARVLKPGGRLLLRVFVGAEQGEDRAQVCDDALNGRIAGLHAFKWRLSMAIASESSDYGVDVAETSATFDRLIPDRQRLAAVTGWTMSDIETIDFYRGTTARYSYPPLSQVRKTIPDTLRENAVIHGQYELAERCPILVLETRQ